MNLLKQSFAILVMSALCSSFFFTNNTAQAEDWPQWFGPNRQGVWNETGILDKFPKEGPRKLWEVAVGGGYAGPATAKGKVYITDRVLDQGVADHANLFSRTNSKGKERLICFSQESGKTIWEFSYPCHYTMSYPCGPRCTPAIQGNRVIFLGAMGDINCLDAATGKLIWNKSFPKDYQAPIPVWGFASHPLIYQGMVITLVGPKKVAVAFDLETGVEKWSALTLQNPAAEIGYAPPMVFDFAGKKTLVIWHSESVNGLDPASGNALWTYPFRLKANLSIPTPRAVGNHLLLSSFYNGSVLLEITENQPKVIWKSNGRGEQPGQTDSLHAIMSTPIIQGEYFYGVCSYGQLRCLRLENGKRVWEDLTATGSQKEPVERWANAFLIPHGDRFFLFNEKGDLLISRLTPEGYKEIDRAHLIEPTGVAPAGGVNRKIVWSHPAFSQGHIFVRNDKKLVCFSLKKE